MPAPKTAWTCKVDGDKPPIRLEDIPAKDLITIQKETGVSWFHLVGAPLGYKDTDTGQWVGGVDTAFAMYQFCCQVAGVEPADITAGELMAAFELAEDDRPMSYTEGLPDPLPDDQTTAPSSR